MKVIRSNNFEYKGEISTEIGKKLCFQDRKYNDYYLLVSECKFVDVGNNKVYFLKVQK